MNDSKKFKIGIPIVFVLLITFAILSISIGTYYVSPMDVVKSLLKYWFNCDFEISQAAYVVVTSIRLPRTILGLLVGGGLAISGVSFQAVFANPLTSSDTLGTSAGAGFGACLCIILGLPMLLTQLVSFLFGLLAVGLTFLVSKTRKGQSLVMLLLSGMVVATIFQAGLSFLQLTADPETQLPTITHWLMGSLSKATMDSVLLALPIFIICSVTIFLLRWRLNVLSLSEIEAKTLGMNVKQIRFVIMIASTFITALSVSLCGIIGWIGILVPHITRMIFGNNNRYVVPMSFLLGASILIMMDILARNITTGELPLSILTALVGGPIFIILLRKTGGVK